MTIDVAAAVVERGDGRFLLAQRPSGKVYAGWWEFPGGKLDAGESARQAIARELHEELGIRVEEAFPWITRIHVYAHATVRLHFYRVTHWQGKAHPREGQALRWQSFAEPMAEPMLPANAPVLAALRMPLVYGVTCASQIGEQDMLARIERALNNGLRMLRIREPPGTSADFTRQVVAGARRFGAWVLHADASVASDGIHLSAGQALPPPVDRRGLTAISCHTREELERAYAAEADLAVLGPVCPTPSHPDALVLGWDGFAELARGAPIPIYAIGGLRPDDLDTARRSGAHGIAMIRGAWGLSG